MHAERMTLFRMLYVYVSFSTVNSAFKYEIQFAGIWEEKVGIKYRKSGLLSIDRISAILTNIQCTANLGEIGNYCITSF